MHGVFGVGGEISCLVAGCIGGDVVHIGAASNIKVKMESLFE